MYSIVRKPPQRDVFACSEFVYMPLLRELQQLGQEFPVTLAYLPLEWCVNVQVQAAALFGARLDTARYAIYFSSQDKAVNAHVATELKKIDPYVRLVLVWVLIPRL